MSKLNSDEIVHNIIIKIQAYITVENDLGVFPLRAGDITELVKFTNSNHIQKQIFDKLIDASIDERLENHKIISDIITIDPTILNEFELQLQNIIKSIILEAKEELKHKHIYTRFFKHQKLKNNERK